jgi:ABC-2 type transport system ATP-binding protein
MTHDDTGGSVPALRTTGLGKRYGRRVWGLRDCSLAIPPGAVVGLVGPNGAGKTTLLEMIMGLLTPTEGQIEVFGHTAQANTAQTLARVGYVAQNHPLYPEFSVADMFHLGQAMNPSWDMAMARARMEALDIPLNRKVKTLSGGQQAQVSLAMPLAKRAPLLVLDEPVASLDPVARLEFMREVMAQVAGGGPTVIIASHVVTELERFCDWLIVLARGHVQLAGPVEELLEGHRLLTVPRATPDADLPGTSIHRADSDRHSAVLLRTGPVSLAAQPHPDWHADPVGFEQLVLAYLQRPARAPDFPSPAREAQPPGPTTKVMSR